MGLEEFTPEGLVALALRPSRIQAYVDERLQIVGLTQEEICQRQGIPEELLEKFLKDISLLDHGELLRVIILFGSMLGSPTELATVCGLYNPEDEVD
jgi:hypothetical protein